MYSSRKVDLVGIFSAVLMNDYRQGNQFIEVVHGKAGKDFLMNELRFSLFCYSLFIAGNYPSIFALPETARAEK